MQLKSRNLVFLAIVLAMLIHGALLPYTYGQTYDAYIHMFFADHYHRQWFDPWETRWYTGFTVTAYPPGSHQTVALLMNFLDMRAAFVLVMIGSVTLLTIGTYRFSRIWVHKEAASIAALLVVFSTSISQTIHIFGQLPTIFSIALFLNAMPHITAWIEKGGMRELVLALAFTAGATSAHHVTPLFGTIFFVAPLGLAAWMSHYTSGEPKGKLLKLNRAEILRFATAPARGVLLGVLMLCLIVAIVFPYWHWSITDPITQVNIPHGSRENFLEKSNLGIMFFVIPWGLLIAAIPYVIYKTGRSSLWPLGIAVLFAFLLGTGGTTPLPKLILGPAFGILTLDRFTFWSTLLIMPFAGLLVHSMVYGRVGEQLIAAFGLFGTRFMVICAFAVYAILPIAVALLPSVRPTQPEFVDPAPIVKFMDEDGHNKWRYMTLGLGDQFAYHSALINAEAVDGNYHSARRLPALTNYAVERLENSKYAGVPGLASLNQFMTNADKFHLKYIFSNDEYYDPLLHYTGWNPVTRLQNGMMVWEKSNIPPLPDIRPRRDLPRYQVLMWGIMPLTALSIASLAFIFLTMRGELLSKHASGFFQDRTEPFTPSSIGIFLCRVVPISGFIVSVGFLVSLMSQANANNPEDIVQQYYGHLDFREYRQAYNLLQTELDFDEYLREQGLKGGLLPSYGKLVDVTIANRSNKQIVTDLKYLTALGYKTVRKTHDFVQTKAGETRLIYERPKVEYMKNITIQQTHESFLDQSARNVISPETDAVQKLQSPNIQASDAYMYERDGRVFVAGFLRNQSPFPACIKLEAVAIDADENRMIDQNMGRLGAHRLLPGQTSPYLVMFEGFLKIGDADFNAAYDPDSYSVPEFKAPPIKADISVQSDICTAEIYTGLAFSKFNLTEDVLTLRVSNKGTKSVNTLQLKLSIEASDGEGFHVIPFYIQENLNPGEYRDVEITLPDIERQILARINQVSINGLRKNTSLENTPIIKDASRTLSIHYDAMTYDRLQ